MLDIINSLFYALFILAMGYYFITNLQWYSYKLKRVLFHHTKTWWHLVYFLVPFILYAYVDSKGDYGFVVVIAYLGLLYQWYRGLDKPLVFTGRVKRFFAAMLLFAIFISVVFQKFMVVLPIFFAYFVLLFIEKILFNGFKVKAQKKIEAMTDMKVVGITASYGKTSIKNYIAHILSAKYKTYATPRSVNTFGGVIKDINDDLPEDTEVYVVEMGARGEGDIAEISSFVNPHYAIVGKIGPAHIEYFRTLENIRNTKMEILQSERLKEAWVHDSAMVKPEEIVHSFGKEIHNIQATLDGLDFEMDGEQYHANILGAFNAMNIAVAIKVARALGIDEETIKDRVKTLESTPHRLQRMDAGGKVIIDDSFNGNVDGMLEGFNLASTYEGRKVLVTPGLVEVDDELNVQVAQRANEAFDVIILTGDLNYRIFQEYVNESKLFKLESKDKMQEMLAEQTTAGDLILFANDAPSFI